MTSTVQPVGGDTTPRRAADRGPTRVALAAAPALVLAPAGLTHPHSLTPATADRWTALHVLLLPVFPLLGAVHWLLLRGLGDPLARVARLAAFTYAVFYGGLDSVAGIAAGTLVQGGAVPDGPGASPFVRQLFTAGNQLGDVGARAFLVACVATSVVLLRRAGRRGLRGPALPGAVLLVGGAVPFLDSHIYWPRGVLALLAIALGAALLAAAPVEAPTPAAPGAAAGRASA